MLCPVWSSLGFCDGEHDEYMALHCQLSCRLCQGDAPRTPPPNDNDGEPTAIEPTPVARIRRNAVTAEELAAGSGSASTTAESSARAGAVAGAVVGTLVLVGLIAAVLVLQRQRGRGDHLALYESATVTSDGSDGGLA